MKQVELTKGFSALIDDRDYLLVSKYKWHVRHSSHSNYAETRIGHRGPHVLMHRLLMGEMLPGYVVDHIDGDGLNNQRSNLRIASLNQNAWNRRKRKGVSKFLGVCWRKDKKCWQVRMTINGKYQQIGYFRDEIDAANAYDLRAMKEYGPFANLNFPFNTPIEIDFPSKGTSKDNTPISVSHAGVGVFLFTEAI